MDEDEAKVEQYFSIRGLSCSLFSKNEMRNSKTPDFRVSKNDRFAFFCEVKTSKKDSWLDEQLKKVRVGYIAGELRKDPIFNRITNDIYEASKQFDAVNPSQEFPNVLAIVNHDQQCGFNDLLAVLTGNFFADDGSMHPIYARFSEGRIKEKKDKIHLYIWIDEVKPDRLLFSQTNRPLHLNLCDFFDVNADDIRQIDP
jgi:hypothetical protein